jgi:hypothetical protein
MRINQYVDITRKGLHETNQEGRIVAIEGDTVFITNMNMPFMGTLVKEPFNKNEIKVK